MYIIKTPNKTIADIVIQLINQFGYKFIGSACETTLTQMIIVNTTNNGYFKSNDTRQIDTWSYPYNQCKVVSIEQFIEAHEKKSITIQEIEFKYNRELEIVQYGTHGTVTLKQIKDIYDAAKNQIYTTVCGLAVKVTTIDFTFQVGCKTFNKKEIEQLLDFCKS